jgi:hypothetical protein
MAISCPQDAVVDHNLDYNKKGRWIVRICFPGCCSTFLRYFRAAYWARQTAPSRAMFMMQPLQQEPLFEFIMRLRNMQTESVTMSPKILQKTNVVTPGSLKDSVYVFAGS